MTSRITTHLRTNGGFTLPETLVSIVLTAVLSGMMFAAYFTGSQTWGIGSAQLDAQESWRTTASWLSDDLRESGASVILTVPVDGQPYPSIRFRIADDVQNNTTQWDADPVEYAIVNGNLQRTQGNDVLVIAENISSIQFRRNEPNTVLVSLQAQGESFRGTIDDAVDFRVRLRN